MPSSYLGYPFDPELFLLNWQAAQDPTLTAMFDSGAVQANGVLRSLIANGSDVYTLPFYNVLGGTPDNYDGDADITVTTPDGASQSGIVFGRAHAWKDQDFVHDFNSGADPMRQITSQVAKYWQKQRQSIMLKILNGVFSIEDDSTDAWDEWQNHTYNIAMAAAGTVAETNKLGATTAGDAIQKAVGDNAGIFGLAWMHSKVANGLAGLQLLNYRKYTDPQGIERQLSIADFNGLTVIVDDGCPVSVNATSKATEYTTYLMGTGALQYAPAPVKVPVETGREQLADGGYNFYVTRIRETLHPNGFTFTAPSTSYKHSPTDAQLGDKANWKLCGVTPKAIPMARIISNG